MDVGDSRTTSVPLPASRLMFGFGICIHIVTFFVKASSEDMDSSHRDKSNDEDQELCEQQCGDNGCCENLQCCQLPNSLPRLDTPYAVQVIAVIGACVMTLLLMCLCIIRYRMAAKFTANTRATRRTIGNTRAGRSRNNTTASTGDPSGFSGVTDDVPGPRGRSCPWYTLRSLIMMEENTLLSSSTTPLQQPPEDHIMTPPPYSELDPQGFSFVGGPPGLPSPPPYEEVVKDSENVPSMAIHFSSSSSSTGDDRRG